MINYFSYLNKNVFKLNFAVVMLILLAFAQQSSLNASDAQTVSQALLNQGFVAFSCASDVYRKNLITQLDKWATPAVAIGAHNAHEHSYHFGIEYPCEKTDIGWKVDGQVKYWTEENILGELPNFLNRVNQLLEALPEPIGTRLAIKLNYYDDIRKMAEDYEKTPGGPHFIKMPNLVWHQDRFGEAQDLIYDYLLFVVLDVVGIGKHWLEIGLTPKSEMLAGPNSSSWFTGQDKVSLLKKIPSVPGAGYVIYQRKEIDGQVLLHRRSQVLTFIAHTSPPKKSEFPEPEWQELCDGYESWPNVTTDANYQRPSRKVLILRISKVS